MKKEEEEEELKVFKFIWRCEFETSFEMEMQLVK